MWFHHFGEAQVALQPAVSLSAFRRLVPLVTNGILTSEGPRNTKSNATLDQLELF